jgi:hypothetical protein
MSFKGCLLIALAVFVLSASIAWAANWQAVINKQAPRHFFDPDSVKIEFSNPPAPCIVFDGDTEIMEGPSCGMVNINGKNRFGGYVGFEPFFFIIRGDRLSRLTAFRELKETYRKIRVEYGTRAEQERRRAEMLKNRGTYLAALGPSQADLMKQHAQALGEAQACGVKINKALEEAVTKIKKEFPDDDKYFIGEFMANIDRSASTVDHGLCPEIKDNFASTSLNW